MGFVEFFRKHRLVNLPIVCSPGTNHYSWPKSATLLGIGDQHIYPINVDGKARLDLEGKHSIHYQSDVARELINFCRRALSRKPTLVFSEIELNCRGVTDPGYASALGFNFYCFKNLKNITLSSDFVICPQFKSFTSLTPGILKISACFFYN